MPLSSRLHKILRRDRPGNPRVQEFDLNETRNIGLDKSTCQINGAPEGWSKMPIPPRRSRPLTPQYEDEDGAREADPQIQSILFRLPLEIRQLIYKHLLGDRLIDLEFDPRDSDDAPASAHYQDRLRWRWWHFVYPDGKFSTPPYMGWPVSSRRNYRERRPSSQSYKLQLEWLRSCRRGYMEAIRILYSTNTFVITQTEELVLRLPMLWPESHLSMITSLIIQFRIHRRGKLDDVPEGRWVECCYTPPGTHRRILLDFLSSHQAPERFPRLQSLRLVYGICPFDEVLTWKGTLPFHEELQDTWSVPWEILLASRPWRRFEVTVPTDWERCFQELRRRRSKLQRDDFVLNGEFEYDSFLRIMDCSIFG